MRLTLCLALLASAGLIGCGGGSDHLSVQGSVAVEQAGSHTGFTFAQPTRLDDPRVAPDDGRIAGHCAFSADGSVISVGLTRTAQLPPEGFEIRSFEARFEDGAGFASVVLGEDEVRAEAADCAIFQVDSIEDHADLLLDCGLTDASGNAASLTADISFSACEQME